METTIILSAKMQNEYTDLVKKAVYANNNKKNRIYFFVFVLF